MGFHVNLGECKLSTCWRRAAAPSRAGAESCSQPTRTQGSHMRDPLTHLAGRYRDTQGMGFRLWNALSDGMNKTSNKPQC